METDQEVIERFEEEFYGHHLNDSRREIKDFIIETLHQRDGALLEILEENRNETLWGDEDSNEVMSISIDAFIEAVKNDLKQRLTNKDT